MVDHDMIAKGGPSIIIPADHITTFVVGNSAGGDLLSTDSHQQPNPHSIKDIGALGTTILFLALRLLDSVGNWCRIPMDLPKLGVRR